MQPQAADHLGAGAVGAAALLAGTARGHRRAVARRTACRCSPMSTRPASQAAAARVQAASLLDLLERAGLMNERLNLVHGVWLSARDIAMLAEAGARVVHNPISNLKLKSGVAPILDLHRAGVEIALGCDNYSCAETQNIFVAMRMLCLLPAMTEPEPHPINAALCAARRDADRRQGGRPSEGQVGALKPGMAADLMILDLNEPSFVPFNSAARQIVYRRGRPRGRDRAGRRPAGGARPQARHHRRGRAGGRGRRDLARRSAARSRRSPAAAPTWSRRCSTATAPPGRCRSASSASSAGGRTPTARAGTVLAFCFLTTSPAVRRERAATDQETRPCCPFPARSPPFPRSRRHSPGRGPEMARPRDQHGGAVRRRQRLRHRRAHRRRAHVRAARPAGDRREHAGRRRHDRLGPRRELTARRHHVRLRLADTIAINQTLYKKPLYNAATDFAPVTLVVDQPMILIVRADLPVNTLKEFIAYAKANDSKMQFGSSGVGSSSHLGCTRVNAALGVHPSTCPIAARGRRCRTSPAAASTISARSAQPPSARSKQDREGDRLWRASARR